MAHFPRNNLTIYLTASSLAVTIMLGWWLVFNRSGPSPTTQWTRKDITRILPSDTVDLSDCVEEIEITFESSEREAVVVFKCPLVCFKTSALSASTEWSDAGGESPSVSLERSEIKMLTDLRSQIVKYHGPTKTELIVSSNFPQSVLLRREVWLPEMPELQNAIGRELLSGRVNGDGMFGDRVRSIHVQYK